MFPDLVAIAMLSGAGICAQDVRGELQAMYAKQDGAIRARDFEGFVATLDSGYVVRLRNGQTLSRAEVERHVRRNMELTVEVRSVSTTIDSVRVEGNRAVAIVTHEANQVIKDQEGQPHTFENQVVHRETWVKGATGWRIRLLEELRQIYLRRDGK